MMKKSTKKIILKTSIIGFIGLIVFSPVLGLAATRSSYLVNFVMDNYDEVEGGFYEFKTEESTADDLSVLATRSSLAILDITGQMEAKITDIDDDGVFEDEGPALFIRNFCSDNLIIDIDNNDTQKVAYALEGLDLMGKISSLESSVRTDIINYLLSCKDIMGSQIGYAYSPEEGLYATVYGTFFALECYYHLGLLSDVVDEAAVTNFIVACMDTATTGKGFNSNSTNNDVSLENTYYALQCIDLVGTITSIGESDRNSIDDYLESFYVDDEDLTDHYGGYTLYPLDELPFATMLTTYYAVCSRFIVTRSNAFIGDTETEQWVLDHQNPSDGGFMDNVLPGQEQHSSTIVSFYATKMLYISDSSLSNLDAQIWTADIDWVTISIILVVVVASVALGIIGYRKRSRI